MQRILVNNVLKWAGYCPLPKCEHKVFTGDTQALVKADILEHLKKNLQDPNHSDIADKEGWFDPDPLGD